MKNLALAVRLFGALYESGNAVGSHTLWSWEDTRAAVAASPGREDLLRDLDSLSEDIRERVMRYCGALEPLNPLGEAWLFVDEDDARKFAEDVHGIGGYCERLTPTTVAASGDDKRAITELALHRGGEEYTGPDIRDVFERVDVSLPFEMVQEGIPVSLMETAVQKALRGQIDENDRRFTQHANFYGRLCEFAKPHKRILGVDARLVEGLCRAGMLNGRIGEAVAVMYPEIRSLIEQGEQPPVDQGGSPAPGGTVTDTGSGAENGGVAQDTDNMEDQGTPAQSKSEPQDNTDNPTEPGREQGQQGIKLSDGTVVPEPVLKQAMGKLLHNLATQLEQGTTGGKPEPKAGDAQPEDKPEEEPKAEEPPKAEQEPVNEPTTQGNPPPKPAEQAAAENAAPQESVTEAAIVVNGEKVSVPKGYNVKWSPINQAWLVMRGEDVLRVAHSREDLHEFVGELSAKSYGSQGRVMGVSERAYSKKAQAVIGSEMSKQKRKKMPQKQKVARAIGVARSKGLKVPPPPGKKRNESYADYAVGKAHADIARTKAPTGKVASYVSDEQGGFYVEYVSPAEAKRREREWERDYDGYLIPESIDEANVAEQMTVAGDRSVSLVRVRQVNTRRVSGDYRSELSRVPRDIPETVIQYNVKHPYGARMEYFVSAHENEGRFKRQAGGWHIVGDASDAAHDAWTAPDAVVREFAAWHPQHGVAFGDYNFEVFAESDAAIRSLLDAFPGVEWDTYMESRPAVSTLDEANVFRVGTNVRVDARFASRETGNSYRTDPVGEVVGVEPGSIPGLYFHRVQLRDGSEVLVPRDKLFPAAASMSMAASAPRVANVVERRTEREMLDVLRAVRDVAPSASTSGAVRSFEAYVRTGDSRRLQEVNRGLNGALNTLRRENVGNDLMQMVVDVQGEIASMIGESFDRDAYVFEQLDTGQEDESDAAAKGFADAANMLKGCRQHAFDLTTNGLVRLESLTKAVGAKRTEKLLAKARELAADYLDSLKELADVLNKANDTFKSEGGKGGEAATEQPAAQAAPAEQPAATPEQPAPEQPAVQTPAAPAPEQAAQAAQESRVRQAVARLVNSSIPERIAEGEDYGDVRLAIESRCPDLMLTVPMVNEVYRRLGNAAKLGMS